ncbi:hypothetical protein PSY23_23600, partial [Shigella flexneri]|nr:hypothetical protein [Shigella flexneri]
MVVPTEAVCVNELQDFNLQLINAYRFRGHQHANLDPLGLWQLINAYRFRGHQHANLAATVPADLDSLGLWQQDKVADLD